MSLVASWLLFPLVLGAVSLGHGLVVERATGERLPGPFVVAIGFAGLIVSSQLTTYWDWSAELTVPLVVAITIAGFVLGRERLRGLRSQLDWPAAVAALGVFAVFAAPTVASGSATFAGYGVLGDTSIHFVGADHLLEHGRNIDILEPSSYQLSLNSYYDSGGYPSGGPTAVGALARLTGQDVAWVFQPFLAFMAAVLALVLFVLIRPVVESARLRAALVFVAAQPALLFAYAHQGSVKEIGVAMAVPLLCLAAFLFASGPRRPRRVVPSAVAVAAVIGIVGLAAGVWVAPVILVATAVSLFETRRERFLPTLKEAALFVPLTAVLSYQALLDSAAYRDVAEATVTAQEEFGNLLGELNGLQAFGVWWSGDYRNDPDVHLVATFCFIGLMMITALVGLVWVARKRGWGPLLFLAVSLLAFWYVVRRGSPWADAKALTIVSPAVVLASTFTVAAFWEARRRVEALVVLAAVGVGVMFSNALAYHDVSLAPRDRLEQLADVGDRVSGDGPTLIVEFEEYAKHFLRDAVPEGASDGWEARYDLAVTRAGNHTRQGFSYELDDFTLGYVMYYRTIVLRSGPEQSRPPAVYERVFATDDYEVWQRPPDAGRAVVAHAPAGGDSSVAGTAPCKEIRALGAVARREDTRLAFVPRRDFLRIVPSETAFPSRWFVDPTDDEVLRPREPGKIQSSIVIEEPGEYELWLEASVGRAVEVFVDARPVGELSYRLNGRRSTERIARLHLDAGRHIVTLEHGGGDLRPGNGGINRLIGPISVAPADAIAAPVQHVAPDRWRSLCGRSVDWVEALRGSHLP